MSNVSVLVKNEDKVHVA